MQQYLLSLQQYLDMRGATPHKIPKQKDSDGITREIKVDMISVVRSTRGTL